MHTRIRNIIVPLLELIEKTSANSKRLDPLVQAESQVALSQLRVILVQIAQSSSATEISIENFKEEGNKALHHIFEPLVLFLSDRWDNIQGTDAVYTNSPYSPINYVSLIIANQLAEIYDVHPYHLLMPTIRHELDEDTIEHLFRMKFQQFIFAENSLRPIDVLECLNEAGKNKSTTLCHTSGKKLALTPGETDRVIHHSRTAFDYYDAITYASNHHYDISDAWQKKEFNHAIFMEHYVVTSSYGDEGKKRLAQYLLSGSQNASLLIHIMIHFVEKQAWKALLTPVPMEQLIRHILKDDWLIGVLQQPKTYSGDKAHDKAILFCLSEIYLQQRIQKEKNKHEKADTASSWMRKYGVSIGQYGKSWLGSYGNQLEKYGKEWLGGYTLEEKEAAVKVFQAFLVSDAGLSENELDAYLRADPKREKCRGALYQGELGLIARQAGLIADPAFFHEAKYHSAAPM